MSVETASQAGHLRRGKESALGGSQPGRRGLPGPYPGASGQRGRAEGGLQARGRLHAVTTCAQCSPM